MPNNDPMITPTSQQLPPITTVYPDAGIATQQPKQPNKFMKVLGGIAGGALNLVAPGLGGVLGSVIGGGGSTSGSYGALATQQQQFDEMQRYNQISTAMQQRQQNQMMNQQQANSMNLIGVQQRVSMDAQEFTSVSNLLKSRHDSEMSAVNNFKS